MYQWVGATVNVVVLQYSETSKRSLFFLTLHNEALSMLAGPVACVGHQCLHRRGGLRELWRVIVMRLSDPSHSDAAMDLRNTQSHLQTII